jgi:hypothetical protein
MRHSVASKLSVQGFDIALFGTGASRPLGRILEAVAEFRFAVVERQMQVQDM